MKLLEDRILRDGKALNDTILKVDSFINHQVDPVLMDEIGKEFANHFKDRNITKVLTVESSGIAPAFATATYLKVPMLIMKKQSSKVLNGNVYQTRITSFTKGISYELTLYKDYLTKEDNVLLIDDFLANGEVAVGVSRLIEMAGAKLSGIGILIEKSFQRGRQRMLDAGYEVHSLVRIANLSEGKITLVE